MEEGFGGYLGATEGASQVTFGPRFPRSLSPEVPEVAGSRNALSPERGQALSGGQVNEMEKGLRFQTGSYRREPKRVWELCLQKVLVTRWLLLLE
ncbi:hypothetical protein MPNT_170010 [Candidatus Methylacidithermus pantelleriae]|uniref:Uncharacterized protein n=1 Tax=Candidatus Methylacidithermus pantelleriae TaxID=2744239 RepID=A0A8J2FNA8_9BACT|nr:hypothetical protein MPNT_170010 [Candidatus Methylacidithermus pantelleriae]